MSTRVVVKIATMATCMALAIIWGAYNAVGPSSIFLAAFLIIWNMPSR